MAFRAEKLTRRQLRFVEEYLLDLNGTQAAIRAGYSPASAMVQASENLTKPKIQAALQTGLKARAERNAITQDWVIQHLRENVERAMQTHPVLDKEGEPTGDYIYQGNVANRALELLGKHLGMFQDVAVLPNAQQLLPGQREIIMRVVYDAPPALPTMPELEAPSNGRGAAAS